MQFTCIQLEPFLRRLLKQPSLGDGRSSPLEGCYIFYEPFEDVLQIKIACLYWKCSAGAV